MREHAHGMRPLTRLISHEAALRILLKASRPISRTDRVPLSQATGRVLASDLRAVVDVPGFHRAAMDGYALRARDLAAASHGNPIELRLAGTVHAGARKAPRVAPGTCVQVATGAPLPPGADAMVPVERTRGKGRRIRFESPVRVGAHVSRRASDMRRGERVLRRGQALTPARISIAAAAGHAQVRVWARPRVALASTGSELVPPGGRLRTGALFDSNGPGLEALLRDAGADVRRVRSIPDRPQAIERFLKRHGASDLLVLSGGSSAGAKDIVQDIVRRLGRIRFHGVRVKPGKPLLFAEIGKARLLGLPGYPTSCLSDAYLYAVPLVAQLGHQPDAPYRTFPARFHGRIEALPDRRWFVPVQVRNGRARSTFKESGATTSLSAADGYVEVAAGSRGLRTGDAVDVVLF